jgi:hypothetical protein
MSQAIEGYLDRVMAYAHLRDEAEAKRVRTELRDHLLEKADVLTSKGTPREDAVYQTVKAHGPASIVGYGLRPKFPLVDVRTVGTARGVLAVGPKAVGVFAFGGMAIGVFAFGGLSIGVVGFGGFVLTLLAGWGGVTVTLLGIALGGFAAGLVAIGGCSIGGWTPGGPASIALIENQMPAWFPFNALSPRSWLVLTVVFAMVFLPSLLISNLSIMRENKRLRASGALAE